MSEDKPQEPEGTGESKAKGEGVGCLGILVRVLVVGLVVAFLVFGLCVLMLRH